LSFYPTGTNGFVDVRDVSRSIIELVESSISAERYILVGENSDYQRVFNAIAKALNVKAPTMIATKSLLELAWRLEAFRCFCLRKNPGITKETARTSYQKNNYSNDKIKKELDFEFNSIEKAVSNTANFLLKFN
jgi:nucleoside-diphosphate-sugar epimerase